MSYGPLSQMQQMQEVELQLCDQEKGKVGQIQGLYLFLSFSFGLNELIFACLFSSV